MDRPGQRRGRKQSKPLRSAFSSGALHDDSLVWRLFHDLLAVIGAPTAAISTQSIQASGQFVDQTAVFWHCMQTPHRTASPRLQRSSSRQVFSSILILVTARPSTTRLAWTRHLLQQQRCV